MARFHRQAVAAACFAAAWTAAGDEPKAKPGNAPPALPAPAAGAGLGIEVGPVPEALRAHLGLGADKGLMVAAVRRGGAGDQAGLKKFDVLLELDGQPISSAAGLAKLLAARKPDAAAKLRLMTSARFADAEAKLGPPDENRPQVAAADDGDDPAPRFPGGLGRGGLPKDLRDRLREAQAARERMVKRLGDGNFPFADGGGEAFVLGGGGFGQSSRTMAFTDATGRHTVNLEANNGQRRLAAHGTDADGNDYDFTAKGTLAEVKKAVKESKKLPEAVRAKALEALGDGEE